MGMTSSQPPQPYRIGQTWNGFRFDGTSWVPYNVTVPAGYILAPGDVINGFIWDGRQWRPKAPFEPNWIRIGEFIGCLPLLIPLAVILVLLWWLLDAIGFL